MYRLPPLYSTIPTLWLPPKVWLHGSQSSSTGGCSARNGHTWSIACWLAHSIRCVVRTALGSPVDPEVNSSLATVSGPAPPAWPAPGPGAAAGRSRHARVPRPPVTVTTTGSPGGSRAAHASRTAATAAPNAPASSAKTTAGQTRAAILRSFPWSLLCSEYATLTGTAGLPAVNAARVSSKCSTELPDKIMIGRPAAPRSCRPRASASTWAAASPHDTLRQPSPSRCATRMRSGCSRARAANTSTTLAG